MRIRVGLLRYLLPQTLGLPLSALLLVCPLAYVLFAPNVLHWRDPWAAVFALIHALVLTGRLGRFRAGSFAFLYSRGYSRDALWGHTMLASVVGVLAAWLPAALAVRMGLRSTVQDQAFRSPYFPIMAPTETFVPLVWLAAYGALLPACHYAWIRAAQPTRGSAGGAFVTVGFIVAALTVATMPLREAWFRWFACMALVASTGAMLLATWKLHQRLEVQT